MKKNIFLLNWKKIWLIIVIGFISIILHNIISYFIDKEEYFLFAIVVILLPLYLITSAIYSLIYHFKRKVKEDKIKKKEK